jgi:NhaA family Na+:H+ antiporter
MRQDSLGLPPEIADRFMKPFAPFLKIEAASGAVLLVAACAALILSNSAWSTPFLAFWEMPIGLHFGSLDFTRSLRHWVNDGLMTLFFFVVALELERELVLGELRNLRAAALPSSPELRASGSGAFHSISCSEESFGCASTPRASIQLSRASSWL